jgi:predicted phage baseplate assembly protein
MKGRWTGAWWGREWRALGEVHLAPTSDPTAQTPSDLPMRQQPVLLPDGRADIADEVRARIAAFTPDWRPAKKGDAGAALVTLFGEEAEPILKRLNRVPEKMFVEYLRTAGVEPIPPTPAIATLAFTVSASAGQSVLVPQGFQVSAPPATGSGDNVIFETDRDLFATPSTLAETHVQEGASFRQVAAGESPFLPFGRQPKIGNALWLGLDGDSTPGPTLALQLEVSAPPGTPPPATAGGVVPLVLGPVALLSWDVLDLNQFVPAEVVQDLSDGLTRSGIIELRLPSRWRPVRPAALDGTAPLRWLRLRLVSGSFVRTPSLELMQLNSVTATAARTIFDEVLEPLPGPGPRRMRVSQVPVLLGTLVIAVDQGQPDPNAPPDLWREVPSLEPFGPDDNVFVLDAGAGIVTFGDGVHGAAVPDGFRNVVAVKYQVGGGKAGAVKAGAISSLVQSAPFVTAVTNPRPASGGSDEEPRGLTLRRGPQEIRARDRAVTAADYELMALRATGAQVERAHAAGGLHPGLPGRPIPGVVGVLIVPPESGDGPPIASELALQAVADFLSTKSAPAGVTVVVGVPRFHLVRAEVQLVIDPLVNEGAAVAAALQAIDTYLDPLVGGDDGQGWPFGGTIVYAALVRLLLTKVRVDQRRAVLAVPRLSLLVDGLRVPPCADQPIPPHDLVWPARHEVVPVKEGT